MIEESIESQKFIKMLVVDDEPDLHYLVKQKFRRQIRNGIYELAFANNGKEAIDMLEREQFEIVLSDINMPVMDGLTLLSKLAQINPILKAIIVSAYIDGYSGDTDPGVSVQTDPPVSLTRESIRSEHSKLTHP